MDGLIVILLMVVFLPLALIMWNRQRVKGKVLCVIVRKDKSVVMKLCELKSDFVIYLDRAYELYPDFVRVAKFPMGWPAMLQELVPCTLYDEEDAVPLDWVNIDNRLSRAMELKAALDENWLRKLVQEATAGAGFAFNWRKALPILLIGIGIIGVIAIFLMKG